MGRKTIFEILGIENKETKISNLFAYYIKESKEFLNLLCDISEIDRINENTKIFVDREFYFTLDGYDNKNNYIDILIRVGSKENPERIICIENKIYASEGYKQTERYQKGMELLYPNACRDYVFITKNNSFVKLSSTSFKHIRYMSLIEGIKNNDNLKALECMNDFCEYYYERELRIYSEIEREQTIMDENTFIDYFVWKINQSNEYEDLYVCSGSSTKSSDRFIQISKQEWLIRNTGIYEEMTIHLEGNSREAKLHFEPYPYIPFSKMDSETKSKFEKQRNRLRELFNVIEIDGVEVKGPTKKDSLTIVKFKLTEKTAIKSVNQWLDIVGVIDRIIKQM